MSKTIIELKNISKHYDYTESKASLKVLNCINLKLTSGESIAVTGPSGSGKSTLLNIIGTLDKKSDGCLKIFGKNIDDIDNNEILQIRNKRIGFVFQFHHLLPQFNVLENILIPTIPLKTDQKLSKDYALYLIEKVGLSGRIKHNPAELSGGECQRVAVARALINKPEILIADEPTGCLDEENSIKLINLMTDLNMELKMSMICATHSLILAKKMDTIYKLKNGTFE